MLTGEQVLGFAIASFICIVAPGPDNLAVLSLGLARGRRAGIGYGLGCSLGCLTHTTWAALGISAILAASEVAFQVLKIAGALYLFYLGIMAIRSQGTPLGGRSEKRDRSFPGYLVRGLVANAINPKVALFFLAFLPQFVGDGGSVPGQITALGILFSLGTALIFSTLGYFSGSIGTWMRSRLSFGKWLDRMTGGVFIALGLRLILARNRS